MLAPTLKRAWRSGRFWAVFILALGGMACHGSKGALELHAEFENWSPQNRTGVSVIEVERTRKINCFGFRGVRSYPFKLDFDEMRKLGASGNAFNQVRIKVQRGRIIEARVGGTKKPLVDQYVLSVIQRWQSGQRYVSFEDADGRARFERVEFLLKIRHNGKLEVIFTDFEITQPTDPDNAYRNFYTLSRETARMAYLIPTAHFKFQALGMDPGLRPRFHRELVRGLADWKAMNPSDFGRSQPVQSGPQMTGRTNGD